MAFIYPLHLLRDEPGERRPAERRHSPTTRRRITTYDTPLLSARQQHGDTGWGPDLVRLRFFFCTSHRYVFCISHRYGLSFVFGCKKNYQGIANTSPDMFRFLLCSSYLPTKCCPHAPRFSIVYAGHTVLYQVNVATSPSALLSMSMHPDSNTYR